jgi:hypothetical protein
MKIKGILAVSMLVAASLLGGCGDKEQTAVAEPEIEKIADQSVQDAGQETEEGESDEPQEAPQTDTIAPDSGEEQTESALTEAECEEYTNWINEFSNYGFLFSNWTNPEEIDLWEVFYSGAGISEEATQEQIDSYLARTGQDELYTDFFVIPKSSMNTFLLEKVGLTYDELVAKGSAGMGDAYDPEMDCFEMQVGDTNYMQFTVESGERNGEGNVSLHYRSAHMWEEEISWIESGIVELVETENGRQFLSNQITEGTILQAR